MPFAGFELNPKHTRPWVTAIGEFMVNFGGVELTTFLWIDRLSDDLVLKELTLEMPLARRIAVIRRLLESRELAKKLLNEARSAWGKVEKLASFGTISLTTQSSSAGTAPKRSAHRISLAASNSERLGQAWTRRPRSWSSRRSTAE